MIHKQVAGLDFTVSSPSCWTLTGYPVDICYLGDKWFLSLDDQGHVTMREFSTRDEAIDLVAQAFIKKGVIQ